MMISYYAYKLLNLPKVHLYNSHVSIFPQGFTKPENICEWSRRELPNHHNVLQDSGKVIGGDWDIRDEFRKAESYDRSYYSNIVYNDIDFEESIFYKSMEEHFINSKPWEETRYVQELYNALEDRETVTWGGARSSRKEILDRAAEIDRLYKSIVEEGYKTQQELVKSKQKQIENEILVDIGRNGQLLCVDGKHRLALAKILCIDSVKITIIAVHRKWIEKIGLRQWLKENPRIISS